MLATARHVSAEREEMIGNTVGYKLGTNSRMSDCTNVVFCTVEAMLLSFLSNTNTQSFAELTHLIIGNVHRRTVTTDLLLSLLKEKQRFHPTLKLILLAENKDDVEGFFNLSDQIVVPKVIPSNGEPSIVVHVFLDQILINISTRAEILEMKRRMLSEHPLIVTADLQKQHGQSNRSYYLTGPLNALLEDCFYAVSPQKFSAVLEIFEDHKHLVDYQHSEIKLTALMIAVAKGFTGVVQTLLKYGANPFLTGKLGITALDWCKKTDQSSQLMLEYSDSIMRSPWISICQLYHRIHDPYAVDHMLVLEIVLYITTQRETGRILVTLPNYTDVLMCYELLRESASAKAKRMDFMVYHRFLTEEEVNFTHQHSSSTRFVVILLEVPLIEMLPAFDNIDYVIDTGLRSERVYTTKEAYLDRTCYNNQRTASFLGSLAKNGCFFLYTRAQFDAMPANDMPNRNGAGQPLQILQVLIARQASGTPIETFFDSALTSPPCTNVNRSVELLVTIGAIERPLRQPTNLGTLLTQLQIEPHLGKALLYSMLFKCLDPMVTIVAALRVGEPYLDPTDEECMVDMVKKKQSLSQRSLSDCLVLLRLYQQWSIVKMKQQDQEMVTKYRLKTGAMDAIVNLRVELMAVLRSLELVKCGRMHNTDALSAHADCWVRVKACLTAAFYPKLAMVDFGKRSLRDHCEAAGVPLRPHPSSVVSLDDLPTKWIIYDHKEDFMLAIQDQYRSTNYDSAMYTVGNTAITDLMVMLLCDIDEHRTAGDGSEALAEYVQSPTDGSMQGDGFRELLIGRKYIFQLTNECYHAIVWLRCQIARLFRDFVLNPVGTLEHSDVKRVLEHVVNILKEEEKCLCFTQPGGIGIKPKIRSRCPMGEFWNQRFNRTASPRHH
ncbi:3'-5' RNA helicase YTHDC2-like [Anopheles ziemanni]|uniref:3'-5' RNA helicase YTHDC2-like n=1 Tax=Anopheles coustani TaxID=139045 RepID=UPI002658AED4|nr:3'-5' RNA helicase YTHDC2-like [Anopheles coustani]XP_058177652.1 3'-5' RNA helicase YTHDC2-like [Anopheles ziemanni]